MKNGTIALLASAASLFLTQPLLAQGGPDHGMGHHEMRADFSSFGMMLKSANLTSAQQNQVRQILEANRSQMKSLEHQLHAVREQIAVKLLATSVSASNLAPLQQQLSHDQTLLDQDMIDTALAIRNVLTPEQVSRLAQLHQQLQTLHAQIESLMGHGHGDMSEPPNDE
jgi:Spy/CpxP family protein refolding chaperone